MNGVSDNLIEAIQGSGYKACMVVAGGGSGAVHALLSHSGASRFVVEAQIPYSPQALSDYLGEMPAQACSEEAARLMAGRAMERASRLTNRPLMAIGIACTAALQTNRERKGSDRAFICIQALGKEVLHKLELEPGSRAQQETVISDMLIELVASFVGVET